MVWPTCYHHLLRCTSSAVTWPDRKHHGTVSSYRLFLCMFLLACAYQHMCIRPNLCTCHWTYILVSQNITTESRFLRLAQFAVLVKFLLCTNCLKGTIDWESWAPAYMYQDRLVIYVAVHRHSSPELLLCWPKQSVRWQKYSLKGHLSSQRCWSSFLVHQVLKNVSSTPPSEWEVSCIVMHRQALWGAGISDSNRQKTAHTEMHCSRMIQVSAGIRGQFEQRLHRPLFALGSTSSGWSLPAASSCVANVAPALASLCISSAIFSQDAVKSSLTSSALMFWDAILTIGNVASLQDKRQGEGFVFE